MRPVALGDARSMPPGTPIDSLRGPGMRLLGLVAPERVPTVDEART
jgi:hypothetical protein